MRGPVLDDPAAVAAQQVRLMARYQLEGGFRAIRPDDPIYHGALRQLTAVRLAVQGVRTKFKLAQNRSPETRRKIVQLLRERGRPNEARAAEALESTLP